MITGDLDLGVIGADSLPCHEQQRHCGPRDLCPGLRFLRTVDLESPGAIGRGENPTCRVIGCGEAERSSKGLLASGAYKGVEILIDAIGCDLGGDWTRFGKCPLDIEAVNERLVSLAPDPERVRIRRARVEVGTWCVRISGLQGTEQMHRSFVEPVAQLGAIQLRLREPWAVARTSCHDPGGPSMNAAEMGNNVSDVPSPESGGGCCQVSHAGQRRDPLHGSRDLSQGIDHSRLLLVPEFMVAILGFDDPASKGLRRSAEQHKARDVALAAGRVVLAGPVADWVPRPYFWNVTVKSGTK